jgi:dTDP-4-amino-4,6-dideoxygalactose transaminase
VLVPSRLIKLVDVAQVARSLGPSLDEAIRRVVHSGAFVLGGEVAEFEAEMAAYLVCKHAIGVSSGTDALVCALSALGIVPGDDVITSPFSFIATAGAIQRVGARPRFVDVESETLQLDAARVAESVDSRVKAILPVHLFGHVADVAALGRFALPLVEDAAQAIGARVDGRAVGTFGALGCFSFFPSKPLGAFGDGGLVVTSDDGLAHRVRSLRQHGATRKHRYEYLGGNYRLDALQAAVLRVKLPHLDDWLKQRRALAAAYSERLARVPGVQVPLTRPGTEPAWAHYVIRVPAEKRDPLAAFLAEKGVETAIYYPTPLHLQPVFAALGHRESDFPVAERAAREVLALPLYPELVIEDLEYVVQCVERFLS